jgi:phenylalanyl-tRNA synthetase beta chain
VLELGAPSTEGFVVGRVLTAEAHPNADRLRVCTVDTGDDDPRTIVCGAPNVAAEQTVAVALPGAVMPGGAKLGKAKLRGIESAGMILSETEMEIGEDAGGIAVLETEAVPGTPLAEVLPIAESVLEFDITPNRPDCLSIYGLAREVHAVTGADLAEEPWATDAEPSGEDTAGDYASVRVEVPELCPRFTARVFEDVTIGPSPLWLKARLIAAGQRPINNVVDITNYVMLLTGQPLHAFDLDKVPEGEIIVRAASEGEKMTTLDDVERTLDAQTVVVGDRNGPTGIAGIMGGQVSEVEESTTRVLLEAANWDGFNILRTSNLLSLRSEASTRFEKGIHPDLTMRGQAVASKLLVELAGARLVPGTIDVDAKLPRFDLRTLNLNVARVEALLGMPVSAEEMTAYLERLGYSVAPGAEGELEVGVPADRLLDTTREIDLIEEVARVHGIDEHLPATLPEHGTAIGGLQRHQILIRRLEDLLRDSGLDEAVTFSFVPPGREGVPGLDAVAPVIVHNPLSEEQSAMRTDLLGGLIGVARRNLARGAAGVTLFESGRAYLPQRPPTVGGPAAGDFAGERGAPVAEPHRLAVLIIGGVRGGSWREASRAADFYDAKGLLELMAAAMDAPLELTPGTRPFLHPARGAEVSFGGEAAGWVGELHPAVLADLDATSGIAFEVDVAPLLAAAKVGTESFEDVTTFPVLSEDLAVVADSGVPADRIVGLVSEAGGPLLRSVRVFDVYEGEQVGAGKRSLALRLEFRAPDRTLTDADVAPLRAGIVDALGGIGASLRG